MENKGGLFSSLSIGRSTKSPKSSETLAHPLLGASTSSLNLTSDTEVSAGPSSPRAVSTSKSTPGQGDLPYKPRQKHGRDASSSSITAVFGTSGSTSSPVLSPIASTPGPLSSTSTSTTATFSLPTTSTDAATSSEVMTGSGGGSSSATSRLQLQSLKAAAQKIGLGNGSMGMSMIDTIFDKVSLGRSKDGEWGELIRILTIGKAVLLLPTTPSSSLPITPQTLRDHVAFISPPIFANAKPLSRQSSNLDLFEKGKGPAGDPSFVVVTLSGLVGTIKSGSLSLESTIPVESPLLTALREANVKSSSLSSLRPTQTSSNLSTHQYPSYTMSPENASLPFPPLGKGSNGGEKDNPKDKPTKLGRINPFASLFGGSPNSISASKVPDALSPDRPQTPEVPDTASISSDSPSILADGFNILAYTVSKPIRHAEVTKAITKAIRGYIREELSRLPDKVVDRVLKLVTSNVAGQSGSMSDSILKSDDPSLVIDFGRPAAAGEKLQDFMESIYDDLVVYYRDNPEGSLKRRVSGSRSASGDVDHSKKNREDSVERDCSEGTEKVEAVVSRLFYNRLFSPLESDDARHDEALASRIAALNMLELSLDHLGLITNPEDELEPGTIQNGLNGIIDQIGDELQKLSTSTCLTPKEKADILIKAHKLVVDGLDKLPPIKLRPEGEPYKPSPNVEPVEITPRVEKGEPNLEDAFRITIPEVEKTPIALKSQEDRPVPDLVLTSATEESSQDKEDPSPNQIEEAMSDSVLTVNPEPKASTSGADLILPIIIYAVVKSNPPQLASQLMYLRRYRSAICLTGEASYALVNLTAVVEFLEHVDLAELGLGGESDRVMSIADLSPIGLDYLDESNADAASIAGASSRLRGRVFQVGELAGNAAGSANKVITGVLDSSWTAVRGLISSNNVPENSEQDRPQLRPRQASTFSLASVTASVANIAAAAAATTAAARTRSRANSRASEHVQTWGANQEMVEVSSRPESILEQDDPYPSDHESDESEERTPAHHRHKSDARSIRSVSSMMSKEGRREDRERVSLSDRLANIGGYAKMDGTTTPPVESQKSIFNFNRPASGSVTQSSRRASLLGPDGRNRTDPAFPSSLPIAPPIDHFMTCEVGDIKLAEIGTLLRDYRRLGAAINAINKQS